jgi:hypothetical protein
VSGFLKVHGPAAAMAAFLFAISSFPSLEPPELLGFSPGDKLFHGLVYAVFGFLLLRSVRALMNGAGRQAATATGTGSFNRAARSLFILVPIFLDDRRSGFWPLRRV